MIFIHNCESCGAEVRRVKPGKLWPTNDVELLYCENGHAQVNVAISDLMSLLDHRLARLLGCSAHEAGQIREGRK